MKPFLLISISILILISPSLADDSAHIVVSARDFGQSALTRRNVTLTPIAPLRRTVTTNLFSIEPRSLPTDTNGVCTFSNTLWGYYRLDLSGTPGTSFNLLLNTNFSELVSAAALVTNSAAVPPDNSLLYYTRSQADAIHAGITGGSGQTNWPADSITNAPWIGSAGVAYTVADGWSILGASNVAIQTQIGQLILKAGELQFWETNRIKGGIKGGILSIDGSGITNLPAQTNFSYTAITNPPWFNTNETLVLPLTNSGYATNPANSYGDYGKLVMGTNYGGSGSGVTVLVPNYFKFLQADGSSIGFWPDPDHGGGGLIHLVANRDIAADLGPNGTVQLGHSGQAYNGQARLQYADTVGNSTLLTFATKVGSQVSYSGIHGYQSGTDGWGLLNFYSQAPTFNNFPTTGFSDLGSLVFQMETNGVNIRGRNVNARSTSSSATVAVDFSSGLLQDVSPAASAVTFSITGNDGATTNIVRKIVYLRSGGQTLSLAWPSGVNVLQEAENPGTTGSIMGFSQGSRVWTNAAVLSLIVGPTTLTSTNIFTNSTSGGATALYISGGTTGVNANVIEFKTNSVSKFLVTSSGAITTGSHITSGADLVSGPGSGIHWPSKTEMKSFADGWLNIGNAANDGFTLVTLGAFAPNLGVTTNWPALRVVNSTNRIRLDVMQGTNTNNRVDFGASNFWAQANITATNGLVCYQSTQIPTNSIPASSSGHTNWVLLNLTNTIGGGGISFVATNTASAGSFLIARPTLTTSTWP